MSIVEFLSQPLWQRLGLTLVHFLWQGLAVAVLAGAFVRVFRLKHGNARYAAYLLAFIAMIACPVVTFTAIDIPISPNTELVTGAESAEVVETFSYTALPAGDIVPEAETRRPAMPTVANSIPLGQRISDWLNVSMPWVLLIWMIGVIVLSVRLLMGFIGVYRWRHHLEPLPERLAQRIVSLSEGLGMRRFSRVFISPAVLQAMAVGYLRPMVLLPAAMVTQMQPEMLEAVIAHELAHIRRFDLWINLAQRVTETLLFYHPAVWWLSICLRSERELCCDELAVKATGQRLTYATTLESVGRARFMAKPPILAAGLGQDNKPTLGRVRHILGLTSNQRNCPFWLAGVIAVVFLAALAISTTLALTSRASEKNDVQVEGEQSTAHDLLSSVRQLVVKNQALTNLIRMNYTVRFVRTDPELEIVEKNGRPGRRAGRPYTHYRGVWAQDGIKQYSNIDYFYGPNELARGYIHIIDGKVMKQGRKPDLLQGSIDEISKFTWSSVGPAKLGIRLLDNRFQLSKILLPEYARIHDETEMIEGRETYVVDLQRKTKSFAVTRLGEPIYGTYSARIWIDCERAVPLRIEHYDKHPDSGEQKLTCRIDSIKLHQLPNGGWFPVKGTRTLYFRNGRVTSEHIAVDVSSITIQPEDIPESLFELEFPAKSKIHNMTMNSNLPDKKSDMQVKIQEKKVQKELSKFKTTLPNSVTVELLCLYYGKDIKDSKFWKPDGSLMSNLESQKYRERVIFPKWSSKDFKFEYGFMVRFNPLDSLSTDVFVKQGQRMTYNYPKSEGIAVALVASDWNDRKEGFSKVGNIKVAVASGPWDTHKSSARISEPSVRYLDDRSKIMFSPPRKTDEWLLDVTVNSDSIDLDCFYELKEGSIHHARSSGTIGHPNWIGLGQRTPMFIKKYSLFHEPEQIKNYIIKYRKFEIIEFKNISLQPGIKPDVQVEAGKEALTAEKLVLKLVDNSGRPVAGAKVGTSVRTRDKQVLNSKLYWSLSGKEKDFSDEDGKIVLNQDKLFPQSWNPDRKRALYILNEERQIGAFCEISKDNERNQIELTLEPVCHVHGKLSSEDLEEIGRPLKWSNVYLSFNKDSHGVLSCMSEKQQFDFWVPPGEYKLSAYGSGDGASTKHVRPIIEVKTGQSELDLGVVDLPATKLSNLIGKSAPEIGPIRAWKNGSPVKLSELRGKPVILHFGGGYPSTSRDLPRLVELHEDFHDVGLVIIAIYNCESMEQLEQRFRNNSQKYGGAPDVPFRLAVDGGQGRPIEGTDRTIPGATHAAYEISSYNTTVLINSKGEIVEKLNLYGAKEKLENMLGVEVKTTVSTWRQRFEEVYRLEDNQILKRIAPPFSPERREYYVNEHSDQASAISRSPDRFIFHWTGKLKNWGLGFTNKLDLGSILGHVLRLRSFEYDGPEELLSIELPGDWIIRDEVSQKIKLKALEQLIAEEFSRTIQFEKPTVESQVIVATGSFKFHPPSETYEHKSVHLYADELDPDEGSGGGTADSVNDFILRLGSLVDMPVVDHTESSKKIKVPYRHHRSSYLRKIKDKAEKASKLEMLLANLTKQTELKFRIEKRPVEVWFITEKKKDK